MKANSHNANPPPGEHLPLPAEPRRPNAERGSDEGEHPVSGRKATAWSRLPREEGDFREYYRLR